MEGFVWSLISASAAGFLKAADAIDVHEVKPGILSGKVNEFENYEFFKEQFTELNRDIFNQVSMIPHLWKTGDNVKVYARQCWGDFLDFPINGTVYQNQFQIESSVIVSIHPKHLQKIPINSVGGITIEVYPEQLRPFRHKEKHPTLNLPGAKYLKGSGFKKSNLYSKSIKEKLYGLYHSFK